MSAELRSLYVEPNARRTGVADALVGEFAAWARTKGATRLTVSSYVENDAARAFYGHRGFAEVSVTLMAPI